MISPVVMGVTNPSSGPRTCATRALKNLRQLRQGFPELLRGATVADLRSPGSVALLGRLERSNPQERARLPGPWGRAAAAAKLARPGMRAATTAPLFSGTLWFVDLGIATTAGVSKVAAEDLQVALAFARLAAPPIARYAGQYGPNTVTIAPTTLPYAATLPDGRFSDSVLQGWVHDLVGSGGLAAGDGLAFLNPPAGQNADAPVAQGVLGYHGHGDRPYLFVNVLGAGLSVADPEDRFALALSHEIAEMVVDPLADASNPEVCDPCGPNCQTPFRDYFAPSGTYLGSDTAFPPPYGFGFFLNAIVQPASSSACPAPPAACAYAPP